LGLAITVGSYVEVSESAPESWMKRRRLALAVALLAVLAVAFAAACDSLDPGKSELQSYSCEGDPGALGRGLETRVETRNGEVQSLAVETHFPGLPGKWGYSCSLGATRGDYESSWKTDGLETTVDFLDETITWEDGDYARLVPVAGGYRIDLRNTKPSMKCGAGAGLPREIVVIGTGNQCQASWDLSE
jgi:hypothetical protein